MILSDAEIKKAIITGRIKVNPMPDFKIQLGSCSLDLRLSDTFRIFTYNNSAFIDVSNPETYKEITKGHKLKKDGVLVLHPGEFVLGATIEKVKLPDDVAARIDGRSSLGRLGLVVHSTAGHIDPGFDGNITLEIANIGKIPIILRKNLRVCHLVFENLSSPTTKPYRKKKGAKWNKAGSLKKTSLM
ncbi:dCTP deaminase [Candidatus Wolfebacteria bacterium]|nr:dCTP deaminase [Candidatus Wolfebacteria bacterium]